MRLIKQNQKKSKNNMKKFIKNVMILIMSIKSLD